MPARPDSIQRLVTALAPLEAAGRPLFGEQGIYVDEVFLGGANNGVKFVKITDAGSKIAGRISCAPPYPGATDAYMISPAKLRQRDWHIALVQATRDDEAKTSNPWRESSEVNEVHDEGGGINAG